MSENVHKEMARQCYKPPSAPDPVSEIRRNLRDIDPLLAQCVALTDGDSVILERLPINRKTVRRSRCIKTYRMVLPIRQQIAAAWVTAAAIKRLCSGEHLSLVFTQFAVCSLNIKTV